MGRKLNMQERIVLKTWYETKNTSEVIQHWAKHPNE
jgi:hypothetical protein